MLNQKYNSLLNLRHFILYLIFGCTSMLLGLFFLYIFYQLFNFNFFISYFLSANIGIFSSFTLNRIYTFNASNLLIRRFLYFYLIAFFGIIVGYLSALAIREILLIEYILASFFSYFIVYIFQYTLNKLITFRK